MQVAIERIAAGGDGVGRLEDGRIVFVPRTAPEDVVELELMQSKARYARGRVAAIVKSSPSRVEPACPHYSGDRCGGCQLQHLSPEAEREVKRRVVGDALRRIGGRSVDDPIMMPSPVAWRYRAKITLAVSDDLIGLRREGNPDSVFDVTDCRITSEPLMALLAKIRTHRGQLPKDLESLVLREDREGGLHLIAIGGGDLWDARPLAAALADPPVSVWWRPERGAARIIAGARTGFPALAF
jgi:23S rRNA (uracil1939-C5)-methyltransferase